jgi:glucosamine--fructose-6-phosphate aminotransferase (isomerizing)
MLLRGLERLEYRGYDSAGIALVPRRQGLCVERAVGRVEKLRQRLSVSPFAAAADGLGLAHTRWATHGPALERNAHPHVDCSSDLAVVHNGIIENHDELRAQLQAAGHLFRSDTDTEVVSHLVESYYQGDIVAAVRRALLDLRGTFALGVIHHGGEREQIVVARSGSPLTIGIGEQEAFIASDVAAMLEYTRRVVFLQDGDLAVVRRDGLTVFDADARPLQRQVVEIDWSAEAASRGGYEHYMRKEIAEQPEAIRRTLSGRLKTEGELALRLPELDLLRQRFGTPQRILITGCGTSYHAALLGKMLIERWSRIPVEVDVASELRYRDPLLDSQTLVVAISQSGETADTLAALRLAKEKQAAVLAICNVLGSTIAREADATLLTQAGPEIGVASTKAFTTQIALLYLLALRFAEQMGKMSPPQLAQHAQALQDLPALIQGVLDREPELADLAERYHDFRAFLFLGRGELQPIALEGALKLKEITYQPAEGYAAGEMKHGPIALVDPLVPSVFLVGSGPQQEKILANMEEIAARNGPVIAFTDDPSPRIRRIARETIQLPRARAELAPIIHAVAVQLLSYHVARRLQRDIDRPRNLAKSVTVE